MLKTACHCGAVTLEMARRPTEVTECNCSACRRYAARWAYCSRKAVRLTAPENGLGRHSRGKSLWFVHCRTCACVVLWEPRTPPSPTDRLGVNTRLAVDPEALKGLRVRRFDGARTWTDIAERVLDEPEW